MAMLAEPRRRQRWTLNPRGTQWSEDSNKFGQKMLEKMGWSSGKGLGRNMDGITEHIRARYKNDQGGVGFSDKDRDKQWTQQQDGYSELLQQLQSSETAETVVKDGELSGKSLELKSKQSRARVHYRKFTRGKDVNKYSPKDLANIFGKKDLSDKSESPVEPIAEVDREPEAASSEPEGSSGTYHGVMTIKGGSIADYFKSKMSALGRRGVNDDSVVRDVKSEPESEDERYVGFGFASSSARNEECSLGNGAFENRALDTASPEVATPDKGKSAYVFENAALELGDSPEVRTPKRRRSEGLDSARTYPITPEVSVKREKIESPEEAPKESSELESAGKKRRKKSKDCCAVNPGFVDEASSPESREIDDARGADQFEVSRRARGLANVALDLSDESSGKKRVTFNDRVEYEIEARGKKRKSKNAGKLDKFEVDNEKLRKKRKREKTARREIAAEGAFANEALEREELSEEANDNALNERKIQRARRKRGRRVSSLETIEEAPEEDREVTKVAEFVTLDDSPVGEENEEPEVVDLVTPRRKKKKRRKDGDESMARDNENVNDAEPFAEEIANADESSKRDKAPKQPEPVKTIEIVDIEDIAERSKKRKKEASHCEPEVVEVSEKVDESARETRKEKAKKKKSKKSTDKENVRVSADEEHVEAGKKPIKLKKEKRRASAESDETKEGLSVSENVPVDSPRILNTSVKIECEETNNEAQSGPQSPWDGKAKISKKIIKALFTRSPVVNFAGSNINEIKGYGAHC